MVDNEGLEINKNKLIALISSIILEKSQGGTIVTDSLTSDGLPKFIEGLGGKHRRFKRGYKNVINEALRLEKNGINAPVAIETSGHCALKENHYLDDGAYLICKILIKMAQLRLRGENISSIVSTLEEPIESVELRFKIMVEDFIGYGVDLLSKVEKKAKAIPSHIIVPNNEEGIRISFDKNNGDGWILLRMSLHDPVMAVNIESNVVDGSRIIAQWLNELLFDFDLIDKTNLIKFLK